MFRTLWLLIFVSWCFLPSVTSAGEGQEIEVLVVVFLGSEKHKEIPDKFKELAVLIRQREPKITGLKCQDIIIEKIMIGATKDIKLVDGLVMPVTIEKPRSPQDQRVCLTVKPPTLGMITFACECGKFVPMMTDHKTKATGEQLIIAIRVKNCMLKKCD